MKKYALVLLVFTSLKASSQDLPNFKQLRYDEDYTIFENDSSGNWYRATKYQPLSRTENIYLSIGGDIRYQYLRFNNEKWGEAPDDKDGYVLTRYLAHADIHIGTKFRTFVQLQSSLANGMQEGASPVDENQLDLHQAFVDFVPFSRNMNKLTLRIGRQELLYGSQRLVAVRDGPNNRQSFDAAKLIYSCRDWKTDFFFSHYVRSFPKIFDDGFNKNTKFWGSYLVKNKLPFLKNIDLYYLGIWKAHTMFDDGVGKELRHSIGSRIWNNKNNVRYDIEGLYQFGKFTNKNISAWTFSINAGYKFEEHKLKPEVGLKTEWISGNKEYGDGKLQTFNPLFPRGGYFGLVSLIGPVNLLDVHPSVAFELTDKLLLDFDCDIFFRQSKRDGIYGPNVALIYSGKNSTSKYIGNQISGDLIYTPNNFLFCRLEFTWFKAGDFLREVGPGKNISFFAVTTQLKF